MPARQGRATRLAASYMSRTDAAPISTLALSVACWLLSRLIPGPSRCVSPPRQHSCSTKCATNSLPPATTHTRTHAHTHTRTHADDFGDMDSFLMESSSEQPGITDPVEMGRDDFGDEPPVLCETICRPLNASEAENAAKDAQKVEAQIEEQKIKSNAAANAPMAPTTGVDAATGMGPTGNPMLFLEVEKKICGARGGKWKKHHKTGKHECEPFMQPSKGLTTYDPVDVYGMCAKDFSADYAPCNPYQALALAHLYEVPDRQHYWLWPGGRAEQVKSAALKQEIGNNPVQGLDKCPEGRHVGFFHNWDATHVDSWGCFDDAQKYKVLCCRRR